MRAARQVAHEPKDLGHTEASRPNDTHPAEGSEGHQPPYDRIDYLAFLTALVVCGQSSRFEHAVRLAYHAGANRDELLTAVELGRVLGGAPDAVVVQAHATVQAWDLVVGRIVRAEQWAELHA